MSTPTPPNPKTSPKPGIRTSGQMLLVIARWVLVIAGLSLVLWNPGPLGEMRFKILFLLLLSAGNFFLGTKILRSKGSADWVVYGASLADLAVISLIIVTENGFSSPTYIFYYPAILAISVAFPTLEMFAFTGGAVSIYGLVSLFTMDFNDGNFQTLMTRVLMMVAVAVIGNLYRRMEQKRQRAVSVQQESAEDIFFGQIAIVWARWFFIAAAAILVLWTSETTGEMTTGVLLIATLMSVNFFIHGRYLSYKPANQMLTLLTALIDLGLITFIVAFWGSAGGLASPFFIFLYPLFFAFALVFRPRLSVGYTVIALASYAVACLAVDPQFIFESPDVKQFVMRMITLAAMTGLGTYYYRTQRERRREIQNRVSEQQPIPAILEPAMALQNE